VLAGARAVATEIFKQAGLQTVWLDCSGYQTDCGNEIERPQFAIRILTPAMQPEGIGNEVMGFAMPCVEEQRACIAYILYDRIAELAAHGGTGPARLLGHAIVHEVGHALLGPEAHDLYGIMQARLALTNVEQTLFFTTTESRRLRAELLSRNRIVR